MSDDIIARAEAALEGVSEGTWGTDPHPHYDLDDWQTDNVSSLTAEELDAASYYDVDGANGGWIAHCAELADAGFIAAARLLVPELVAELKTTRAQRDEFAAQLDDALRAADAATEMEHHV